MTLWGDAVLGVLLLVTLIVLSGALGFRDGLHLAWPSWWTGSKTNTAGMLVALAVLIGVFAWLHFRVRGLAAGRIVKQITGRFAPGAYRSRLTRAFLFNTRPWLSIFMKHPVGWGQGSRKRLQRVIAEANRYVQTLNDHFTDPSGTVQPAGAAQVAPLSAVESATTSPETNAAGPHGPARG
jgi:hypothetical protein